MFHNASIFKDIRDFTKKNEEVRNLFTNNCKPTTSRFNIVQRVTAGLSFLHEELLAKRKLAIELKKKTPSAWKTAHTGLSQEAKTFSAVWQQSCKIPKSIHWNIQDNGHAGTSRHHSGTLDDIPGK
jgi:hypothetical protein